MLIELEIGWENQDGTFQRDFSSTDSLSANYTNVGEPTRGSITVAGEENHLAEREDDSTKRAPFSSWRVFKRGNRCSISMQEKFAPITWIPLSESMPVISCLYQPPRYCFCSRINCGPVHADKTRNHSPETRRFPCQNFPDRSNASNSNEIEKTLENAEHGVSRFRKVVKYLWTSVREADLCEENETIYKSIRARASAWKKFNVSI